MKTKLKTKYLENGRFQVSIEGAPIEEYQRDTIRGILCDLINDTESLGALAHVAEVLIHNHPNSKKTSRRAGAHKITLKVNI